MSYRTPDYSPAQLERMRDEATRKAREAHARAVRLHALRSLVLLLNASSESADRAGLGDVHGALQELSLDVQSELRYLERHRGVEAQRNEQD